MARRRHHDPLTRQLLHHYKRQPTRCPVCQVTMVMHGLPCGPRWWIKECPQCKRRIREMWNSTTSYLSIRESIRHTIPEWLRWRVEGVENRLIS